MPIYNDFLMKYLNIPPGLNYSETFIRNKIISKSIKAIKKTKIRYILDDILIIYLLKIANKIPYYYGITSSTLNHLIQFFVEKKSELVYINFGNIVKNIRL